MMCLVDGRVTGKDKFLLFLIPGEVCSQVVPGSLESLGGKKGGGSGQT